MNKLVVLLALGACCIAGIGTVQAGTDNVLYLSQQSDPGTADGNSFHSDQTLAEASSIGSLSTPALQKGHGNSASITIESSCSEVSLTCGNVDLSQDNSHLSSSGTLAGNTANITLSGNGSASVLQSGGGNTAVVSLEDTGLGTVTQTGSDNHASLTLTGDGNHTSVNQMGDANVADLSVLALAPSAGFDLTQYGGEALDLTISTNVLVTYTHIAP